MSKSIKEVLKNNICVYKLINFGHYKLRYLLHGKKTDEMIIRNRFRETFERELNLENPITLNEKLQWLKLNIHDDYHTICADKYKVREVWKQFGEEGLIPLLYQTYDWRDITTDVIPDVPCIIKCNTGSAMWQIIRNKKDIDIKQLRKKCQKWLSENYYYRSQEWQYKNIKNCIIIEKLILDENGNIPNDYKLNFINGELKFIYCSIDREGANYRAIYDPNWKRINVEWVTKQDHKGIFGPDISQPKTFEKMKIIGTEIAKKFAYVRVDFYEADGKLYYGEITLHHGSGFDTFEPEEYDSIFGSMLVLPKNKRK